MTVGITQYSGTQGQRRESALFLPAPSWGLVTHLILGLLNWNRLELENLATYTWLRSFYLRPGSYTWLTLLYWANLLLPSFGWGEDGWAVT